MAGVARHRRHVAGTALPGGAEAQDPGDLQASVAKGLRAISRRARRARVLAARRIAQQGDGRDARQARARRVFRDGSVRSEERRVGKEWRTREGEEQERRKEEKAMKGER